MIEIVFVGYRMQGWDVDGQESASVSELRNIGPSVVVVGRLVPLLLRSLLHVRHRIHHDHLLGEDRTLPSLAHRPGVHSPHRVDMVKASVGAAAAEDRHVVAKVSASMRVSDDVG